MKAVDIPVPPRMRHLERDGRGYPIPDGVMRDASGTPLFTINDEAARQKHLAEDRCPICGTRLIGGRWFVGGPRSAFHRDGAYIDPPMHDECAHYALMVCPYLAAPNYSKRLDDAMVKPGALPAALLLIDQTMIPERPELFVAVLALRNDRQGTGRYIRPERPYLRVEYWRQGERVDDEEGRAIAERVAGRSLPPLLLAPRVWRPRP